jgi:hypothetical protein
MLTMTSELLKFYGDTKIYAYLPMASWLFFFTLKEKRMQTYKN